MTNVNSPNADIRQNEGTPQRITLRHLSGSRANQIEEFPLSHFKELLIGRDPSAAVRYDAGRDDLVSRRHAKIVQDSTDSNQFLLVDLGSRNGSYVNKQRVVDSAKLIPGDVIQFGPNGPEFQFDIEPRPEGLLHPTRLADNIGAPGADLLAATRIDESSLNPPAPAAMNAPTAVGKTTVMRMVAQINTTARKQMIAGGAALLVIIAVVTGFFVQRQVALKDEVARKAAEGQAAANAAKNSAIQETRNAMTAAAAAAPMTASAIAQQNTVATVFIEANWKLIYTPTGGQVYHEYIPVKDKKGQVQMIAAYIQMPDGAIEPSLTLEPNKGRPIGGGHTGSGFVVTNDGFILTNRHVAATWFTYYHFPPDALPGALFELGQKGKTFKSVIKQTPMWVPAEAQAVGRQPIKGKLLEGRNDYLDVTFAKNELRMPAKLVRTSNRHDVAMIKVDTPASLTKVELNDNYDTIRPGDGITVLGYPAVSPDVVVSTKSNDPFNPQYNRKAVPDPTITGGLIGKLIRGEQAPAGREKYDYISTMGDSYQLTVNATGGGNSGGPVFDERGRVVGIFYAGKSDAQGTKISFAVPIRYGVELMGPTAVLR